MTFGEQAALKVSISDCDVRSEYIQIRVREWPFERRRKLRQPFTDNEADSDHVTRPFRPRMNTRYVALVRTRRGVLRSNTVRIEVTPRSPSEGIHRKPLGGDRYLVWGFLQFSPAFPRKLGGRPVYWYDCHRTDGCRLRRITRTREVRPGRIKAVVRARFKWEAEGLGSIKHCLLVKTRRGRDPGFATRWAFSNIETRECSWGS